MDKEQTLPNFFIVGAAKSGTTTLYKYLINHPEIYFHEEVKEPKFITAQFLKFPFNGPAADVVEEKIIKNIEEYQNLYLKGKDYKIRGDASVDTLYYYDKAIPEIKKITQDPKIVIILRNPVERAFSAYNHMLRDEKEILSFLEALNQEEERINDNWEYMWHYKKYGLYYQQVKAYMENFEHVKVYLFDDLKNDAPSLLKDVLEFLEVSQYTFSNSDKRYNISGVPRNKFFCDYLIRKNPLKNYLIKPIIKSLYSKEKAEEFINKLKAKMYKKVPFDNEAKMYLKNYYREDILKLQGLINRDLSAWLK